MYQTSQLFLASAGLILGLCAAPMMAQSNGDSKMPMSTMSDKDKSVGAVQIASAVTPEIAMIHATACFFTESAALMVSCSILVCVCVLVLRPAGQASTGLVWLSTSEVWSDKL